MKKRKERKTKIELLYLLSKPGQDLSSKQQGLDNDVNTVTESTALASLLLPPHQRDDERDQTMNTDYFHHLKKRRTRSCKRWTVRQTWCYLSVSGESRHRLRVRRPKRPLRVTTPALQWFWVVDGLTFVVFGAQALGERAPRERGSLPTHRWRKDPWKPSPAGALCPGVLCWALLQLCQRTRSGPCLSGESWLLIHMPRNRDWGRRTGSMRSLKAVPLIMFVRRFQCGKLERLWKYLTEKTEHFENVWKSWRGER